MLLDAIVRRISSFLGGTATETAELGEFEATASLARTVRFGLPIVSDAVAKLGRTPVLPDLSGAQVHRGDSLGFVRTRETTDTSDLSVTPAWAHGMAVATTAGPYTDADGAVTWVDTIVPGKTIEISRGINGPSIAYVIAESVTETVAGATTIVSFTNGSLWLAGVLFDVGIPADGFVGVAFADANLSVPGALIQPPDPQKIVLNPGVTAVLLIDPVPSTAAETGTLDNDGARALATLPARVSFELAPSRTQVTRLDDATVTIYGHSVALSGGPVASGYDAEFLELVTTFATTSEATLECGPAFSTAFVTSGSAPIGSGDYRLPVARTVPTALAPAANGGAIGLELGSGVSAKWGSVAHALPFAATALSARAGFLRVSAVTAVRPFADAYALWDVTDASGTAKATTIVMHGERGVHVLSEQNGQLDAVAVLNCAIEAHIDRPCLADGSMPGFDLLAADYVLVRTQNAFVLVVAAVQKPPAQLFVPPERTETYVIENAVLKTDGIEVLILRANLSASARADSGLLVYSTKLQQLVPTLPHPYAALLVPSAREPQTLLANVRWSTPSSPALGFAIDVPGGQAPPDARGFASRQTLEILYDVSSAGSQFGVAFSAETLNLARIVGQTLTVDGTTSRLFALPQVSWEAVITEVPPPVGRQIFGGSALALDDGPAALVNVPTATLRPMTPLAFIKQFLHDYADGAELDARFTLPFGLEAVVSTAQPSQVALRPSLTLNTPAFGSQTGGLQLSITAGSDVNHPLAVLPGESFTTSDALDVNYPPAILNSGTDVVASFWNQEFETGLPQLGPFVPLSRIDLSGYGSSTFSDFTDEDIAVGITEARFDVLVGRTSYTLIQVQSVILPWKIPVVNTTIFQRDGAAFIERTNTGWRAKAPGVFDFGAGAVVETGGVTGLFNVRNIADTGAPPVTAGTNTYGVVTFDADLGIVTDPGAHGFTIHGGDIGGGRLAGTRFIGYVDQTASVAPPSLADAVALMDVVKTAGGSVAADVEVATTGIALTLTGVDVAATSGPAPRTLGVALRGLPHLPRDGSWSVAKRSSSQPTPSPIDPLTPVPFVRNHGDPQRWHMAEPSDVLQLAVPSTLYGILQSTGTQKLFFEHPTISDVAGQNPLNFVQAPKLADVGALLGNSDLLPAIGSLLDFGSFSGFKQSGDGLATTQTLTKTQDIGDKTLIPLGPISVVLSTNKEPSLQPPAPAPPNQSVITATIDPTQSPRWTITITNVAFKLLVDGMSTSDDPLVSVIGDIYAADKAAPTLKNVQFGYGSTLGTVKNVLSGIQAIAATLPGGGDSGLDVTFSGTKLRVRDAVSLPQLPLGPGYLEGISLDLGFDIDVLAKDMSFFVGVGSDEHPFSWLASPLAGNGVLQLGAAQTLGVRMQAGIGVGLGIDVAIASGSASIVLAVQIDTTKVPFGVMVLLTGNAQVDVLDGLTSLSLTLTAGLGIQVSPGPESDLLQIPPLIEDYVSKTSVTLSGEVAVAIHVSICWVCHIDWSGEWGFSETISGSALTSLLP